MKTIPCDQIAAMPDRARIRVAGLVVTRQRPGTASGVIFLTLEDETGIANVIVWPKTYERFRRAVIAGRLLRVTGELQREGSVQHLVSWRIEDLSHLLDRLGRPEAGRGDHAKNHFAPHNDEARRGVVDSRAPKPMHPRDQARHLFPSRDFH